MLLSNRQKWNASQGFARCCKLHASSSCLAWLRNEVLLGSQGARQQSQPPPWCMLLPPASWRWQWRLKVWKTLPLQPLGDRIWKVTQWAYVYIVSLSFIIVVGRGGGWKVGKQIECKQHPGSGSALLFINVSGSVGTCVHSLGVGEEVNWRAGSMQQRVCVWMGAISWLQDPVICGERPCQSRPQLSAQNVWYRVEFGLGMWQWTPESTYSINLK